LDRAPAFIALKKGDYQISYAEQPERYDWDDAYYMYFHSKEIDGNNWSRYSNKEIDSLVEKGRITIKTEDRVPIYKRVIEILKEDLPVLFVTKPRSAFRSETI